VYKIYRNLLFFIYRCSQMSVNAVDLFPRTNELIIEGLSNSCFSDLDNCRSSILSLVPWSLVRKISIYGTDFIKSATLEAILRMAYNVHTLEISDDTGILPRAILRSKNHLSTRANEQVSISLLKKVFPFFKLIQI